MEGGGCGDGEAAEAGAYRHLTVPAAPAVEGARGVAVDGSNHDGTGGCTDAGPDANDQQESCRRAGDRARGG